MEKDNLICPCRGTATFRATSFMGIQFPTISLREGIFAPEAVGRIPGLGAQFGSGPQGGPSEEAKQAIFGGIIVACAGLTATAIFEEAEANSSVFLSEIELRI